MKRPVTQADLRPAEAEDVPAITGCARAAYDRYVSRIGREPAPMVADFAALVAAGEVHVLLAGGDLAGFIVVRPGPDHLFVENLAVHPDRQGQGLGRRLVAFAEATARAGGLPALELYTNVKMTENFPFYRGLGFVETERRHEDGFDRVYMRKKLA
jgi:ribosomal protein S18 acetylase RimI-like enzyme